MSGEGALGFDDLTVTSQNVQFAYKVLYSKTYFFTAIIARDEKTILIVGISY